MTIMYSDSRNTSTYIVHIVIYPIYNVTYFDIYVKVFIKFVNLQILIAYIKYFLVVRWSEKLQMRDVEWVELKWTTQNTQYS